VHQKPVSGAQTGPRNDTQSKPSGNEGGGVVVRDSGGVLRRPAGQDVLLVGGGRRRPVGLPLWVLGPLLGRNLSCTRVLALLETHDTWLWFRLSLEAAVRTDAALATGQHRTFVRDTGRVSSSADARDDSRFSWITASQLKISCRPMINTCEPSDVATPAKQHCFCFGGELRAHLRGEDLI